MLLVALLPKIKEKLYKVDQLVNLYIGTLATRLHGVFDGIIEGVEGITDTKVSRETGTPEELVIVDRQKAADMKLTVAKIANMLQTVLSGTSAGNFREGGDEYNIRVKLQDAEKRNLQDIIDITAILQVDGQSS